MSGVGAGSRRGAPRHGPQSCERPSIAWFPGGTRAHPPPDSPPQPRPGRDHFRPRCHHRRSRHRPRSDRASWARHGSMGKSPHRPRQSTGLACSTAQRCTSPPRPGWTEAITAATSAITSGTNPFTAGLRLRFTTGAACGLIVKLRSGDQILGSRPPADGHLVADPTVSGKHHVRLNVSASPGVTVTVTDLNSSNGTLVNGLRGSLTCSARGG